MIKRLQDVYPTAVPADPNQWSDRKFLTEWFDLLVRWKKFAPYKQDVAKINMLRRLLKLE